MSKDSPNPTSQVFDKLQRIKYDELQFFKNYFKDVSVLYTMIGCGWCTKCLPAVEKAVQEAKSNNPVLHVVYNDSPEEITEKEDIKGFPTLRRYKGTEAFLEYKGPRTTESYLKFLA